MNMRKAGRLHYIPLAKPLYEGLGRIQTFLASPALQLEVFLHWREFGKQYLTRTRLVLSWLMLLGVHALWSFGIIIDINRFDWRWVILPVHGRSEWFFWYTCIFTGLGVYHRVTCKRDVSANLFDRGESFGLWKLLGISISGYWTICFIEPLFCFAVVEWIPCPLLKTYLHIMTVALFIKNQAEALLQELKDRGDAISMMDAEGFDAIQSEHQHKSQSPNAAVIVAPHRDCPTEETAYANLPDACQAMMKGNENL